MFFILLKTLHLIALMFGSVAALGNVYLILSKGPHDLAAPAYTNTLRKFYRITSLVAVIVLWITGILMLTRYGGWLSTSVFNAKIGFVVLLTALAAYTNFMAPRWARNGGPPSYVSSLAWIATISLLLIVILAGLAFN